MLANYSSSTSKRKSGPTSIFFFMNTQFKKKPTEKPLSGLLKAAEIGVISGEGRYIGKLLKVNISPEANSLDLILKGTV